MGDVGSGRRCARAASAAVTLLVAAAAVGCAGQQHKSIGRTYTSAGDYDRAVEAAKQSLAKSPDSSECIDLLSDAQTAAADFHFEQAKKLMEARRPVSASAELELVLGYMPAHPGGNQLLVQVRAALARRDELIGKAQAAASREDWANAAALAEQACGVDRDNQQAQALLSQARSAPPTTAVVASPAPTAPQPVETPTLSVQAAAVNPQPAIEKQPAAVANPQPEPIVASARPQPAPVRVNARRDPALTRTYARRQESLISVESSTTANPAAAPADNAGPHGSPAPPVRSRDSQSTPVPGRIVNARTRMVERDRAAESANGQVSAARSSGEADRHLMLGIISRDDRRFKKIMAIMDGVTVKIHDADKNPLDVDLEIVAGKFNISPKDVPVGGSVKFQGISKRQYKLTVQWIDYEHESVKFAVDRAD
jgi:tetratricopeptide (TPR) repeat protein